MATGIEWARLDSNQGPTDYESAALTGLSYRPNSKKLFPSTYPLRPVEQTIMSRVL